MSLPVVLNGPYGQLVVASAEDRVIVAIKAENVQVNNILTELSMSREYVVLRTVILDAASSRYISVGNGDVEEHEISVHVHFLDIA